MSGGVSNVSFSFRGNDHVREAIHAAFLYPLGHFGLKPETTFLTLPLVQVIESFFAGTGDLVAIGAAASAS